MTNLRALREAKHLTQEAFAALLGVARPSVANWESGAKFPSARRLPLMAKILDCTIDDLYGKEAV